MKLGMDKVFQRIFLGFFVYGLFYSPTIASFTEDRVTESVSLNRRAVVSQISYTIVDHVLPRTSTITNVAGRIGIKLFNFRTDRSNKSSCTPIWSDSPKV